MEPEVYIGLEPLYEKIQPRSETGGPVVKGSDEELLQTIFVPVEAQTLGF